MGLKGRVPSRKLESRAGDWSIRCPGLGGCLRAPPGHQLTADSPPSEVTQGAERAGQQHPMLRGWEEGSGDFQSMAMAN